MIYNINDFPYHDFFCDIDNEKTYSKRGYNYINKFNSFDIETTSTILNNKKIGFMYLWGFSFFNKYIIVGRTWEEFVKFIEIIVESMRNKDKCMVIYVHNLNFEFIFMKDFLKKYETKIFAVDVNEPIQYNVEKYIEFRCSKKLTSLSLAKAGEKWNSKNRKLNQDDFNLDLDYKKLRTPKTKLTDAEMNYFIADLKTTAEIPQIIAEKNGDNIKSIPLTATGFIRRKIYNVCKSDEYYNLYRTLSLDNEIYSMLRDNSKGGDVGLSYRPKIKNQIYKNVASYDEVSAYIYSALVQYVPINKFKRIDRINEGNFKKCLNKYCCLFDIEFSEIELKNNKDMPIISISHIINDYADIIISSNGRLIKGKKVMMTLNEIDYYCILKYYNIKNINVRNFHYAIRGRLPYQIRESIFKILKEKIDLTYLKGTEKEYIYQQKKEELNGIIGMMMTELIHDDIKITSKGWNRQSTSNSDNDYFLKTYFHKRYHFLYYPWSNWIISHSRLNLYELCECFEKHLYHDTDSCKGINPDTEKINKYNEKRAERVRKHGYEYKGIIIGSAIKDAEYESFIIHNSKQYAYIKDGQINITSAGMKGIAKKQLKKLEDFKPGMIFKSASNKAIYNFADIHEIEINGEQITTASNIYIEESDVKLRDYDNIYDILNEPNRKKSI